MRLDPLLSPTDAAVVLAVSLSRLAKAGLRGDGPISTAGRSSSFGCIMGARGFFARPAETKGKGEIYFVFNLLWECRLRDSNP